MFVVPNLTSGYYVSVYATGTDGLSAGVPMPLHAFVQYVAGSPNRILNVTTPTTYEANFLAQVNKDRAASGAGPVYFDEYTEEAARIHANEMLTGQYQCHYNSLAEGPPTRFNQVYGLGQDGENISTAPSVTTPDAAWASAESGMLSGGPGEGHHDNIVDPPLVLMSA
jgi:uncharacterized protein YkwD